MNLPAVGSVRKVAVLGVGTMGVGWITQLIARGVSVMCGDTSEAALSSVMDRAHKLLSLMVKKQLLTEPEVELALQRVTGITATDPESILNEMSHWQPDIFLEVVTEDVRVKRQIFGRAGQLFEPSIVFWSNTSTLLCRELGQASGRPDRMINTHGMNPVPLMACVEVVPGRETSEAVRDWTVELLRHWVKTPFLAPDVPGFSINRICIPMWNAATASIQQGLSTVEDLDTGMRGSVGFPQGVLLIQDMIGLDVMLLATQALLDQTNDPRYEPPHLLRAMVSAGQLGRKSGRGFYEWGEGKPKAVPLAELRALL